LFALLAALVFVHPAARVLAGLVAVGAFVEAGFGVCPLHKRLAGGNHALAPAQRRLCGLALVQLVLAYEWFFAGLEKVTGEFAANLSGTLSKFASENPFGWYKTFLEMSPESAQVLGGFIAWGELLTGVALALSVVVYIYSGKANVKSFALVLGILALLVGAFMNANFFLAAGWMSPSTHGVNMIMFWIEIALLYVWFLDWRT
jgi:hypothetical protein